MVPPVDLERVRVERLADEIAPLLAELGSLVKGNTRDAERWRKAARCAGRRHGWRIRTGAGVDGRPWAVRLDFEVTPAMQRDAMRRMEQTIDEARRVARATRLRPVPSDPPG